MVLLAASICTRSGKALLSRQFVEMSKARIEGLLAAFPKVMPAGVKQHTFVETDSVRYVYQPMEKLYVVLITTKTSNILEDLETLRLFARVVPEYCRNVEESEIIENAFIIIFAFDEIVALGYRESVNLAQIRTFVEMDSHEEKIYQAVRQTQEREAKQKMREKAKELQRQKIEVQKRGGRPGANMGNVGFGVGSSGFGSATVGDTLSTPVEPPKPTYNNMKKPASSKAMKLGGKSRDVESFVDQLLSEGEVVATSDVLKKLQTVTISNAKPQMNLESVHVKLEEKLTVTAGRDGGLQSMELQGTLMLRISDENMSKIKLQLCGPSNSAIQLQTHPNIDKELLKTKNQIALKNPAKPFPINTEVGVLKWRYQTQEESQIPLSINCWPSDSGEGGCDVNIEYELLQDHFELLDVVITIPVPHGVNAPVVAECCSDYTYEKRLGLQWRIPVIDANNKTGSMEFSCGGTSNDFFPVTVSFTSERSYSKIEVLECVELGSETPLKFSKEITFIPEKYEIV